MTYVILKDINNKVIELEMLIIYTDKQEVMGKKRQLKGTKIYRNHDLSREDRDLQRKLKEIAKQERQEETEVLFEFRKKRINGNCRKWEQRRENNGFFYREEGKEASK